MLKNVEVYWINDTNKVVSFYNDTVSQKTLMGTVEANTPIKLSVDINTYSTLVIKQVAEDKILISSVDMASYEEVES